MNRQSLVRIVICCGFIAVLVAGVAALGHAERNGEGDGAVTVPILVYHRFGPTAADRMTTPTAIFEAQLQYLRDHGYTIIPLRHLLDHLRGRAPAAPPRAVVLTADDGHRSVYTDLFPLARKFRLPITLFIYPSAISNASYALTWEQLRELRDSGLFDIQSHTYWHPNFNREQRRLSRADYDQLVTMQLEKSRRKLEQELGTTVDLLAWPFGIYNPELMRMAAATGYVAAFTIEPHPAAATDQLLALPRFLLTDATGVRGLADILTSATTRR